jgi:hypothetical protein
MCAAWTGVRLVLARSHLLDARSALLHAQQALLDRRLQAATADLRGAAVDTHAARTLTGDPITALWAHVPYLGRSVEVARGLARAADDVTRLALTPALTSSERLDPHTLRGLNGAIDLSVLQAASPALQRASAVAQHVQAQVRALPTAWVVGPVGHAREQLAKQVNELTSQLTGAADAVRLAPVFLGQGTTRHWFVLVQQTGESRGTGGLPGGFAVLEARDGHLKVTSQGSNADLKAQEIATPQGVPADFVNRYQINGAFQIWQNVTLSPDLPVVARVIEAKWKAQGGGPLDGVLTLDGVALADLLKGQPPVVVSPGVTVPGARLEDYLALGQYRDTADPATRKDKLTGIARQVLDEITDGRGDSSALLHGVVAAVRSGHLHLASDDPQLAPVLARTGLDGSLPRGPAPVAYAVVNNASGDKLEYFLDRSVTYAGGSCHGGRRRTTVTVRLRNEAPPVGTLPSYVTIRLSEGKPAHSTTGRVLLEVYGTRGASLVSATLQGRAVSTVDGRTEQTLVQSSEAGLPVWQVTTDTPPGRDVTFVLHLDEPTPGDPADLLRPGAASFAGVILTRPVPAIRRIGSLLDRTGRDDRMRPAEALALTWLVAGPDVHAKNSSLLLPGPGATRAAVGRRECLALPGLPRAQVQDGHEARWDLPGRVFRHKAVAHGRRPALSLAEDDVLNWRPSKWPPRCSRRWLRPRRQRPSGS